MKKFFLISFILTAILLSLVSCTKKEKEKDEASIKALRASINNGSVRLSISTTKSRITTTESGEKRAELDTETANSLISITEDGDRAIRDLNQCVDTYNKVKEIYDGKSITR